MSNSPRVPGSGNSDDDDAKEKDQGNKPASPFASKPATPNPFANKSSEPARSGGGGSSSGTGSPFGSKPAGSPSPFGSGNRPNDPPKPGGGSSIFGGGNKPNDPPKTGPLGGGSGSGSGSGTGSPFGSNKPAGGGSPFAPGGGNRPDDDKNKTGSASSASPKLGAPTATPAKPDDKSGGGTGGRLGGLFGGGNKPDDKKDDKPAGGGTGAGAGRPGGLFGGGGNKPDDKKDAGGTGAGAGRPGGLFGGGGNKPDDKKDDKAGAGAGGRLGGLFGGGSKPADNKPAAPKLGGTPAPAGGAKPADKKDAGGGGSPFARIGGMFARGGDKGGDKPATPKLGSPATPAKPADKNAAGGRANPLNSVGARLGSIFNRGGGDPQKALKAPQIPPDAKKGTGATGKAALPPARGDKPARPLERAGTSLEVKNRGLSLDQKLDLVGYALMIAALVMFGGLVQPSEGSVTRDVANLLGQLFGYGRFIWPAISMFVGGWLLIRRFKENPLLELDLMRIIGFTLLYLTAVTVLHFYELVQKVVPDRATLFAVSEQLARQQIGGGWVGDKIYQALIYVVGEWGVPFVLVGLLAIGNMLTFEITLGEIAQYVQSIFRWFGRVGRSYGDRRAIAKEASDKRRAERAAEKAARDAARLAARPAAPALTVETPALAQVAAPAAAALAAPAEAKPEIPRLGRGNTKPATGTTAATTATPTAEQAAPAIPKLTTPKPLGKAEPPAAASSAPALRPVAAAAAAAAIAAPDIDDEDEDYEDDDAPEVSAAPAIPKLSTPPAPLGRAPSNPPPTTPAPTSVPTSAPAPTASASKLAEPMAAKEDTRPLESTRPITTPAPTATSTAASASTSASKPNIFGKPLGTPDEKKDATPLSPAPAASAIAEKVEAKPDNGKASGTFNPFKAAQPQPQAPTQEKPASAPASTAPAALGGNGSASLAKPVDPKADAAKMPIPDEYADDEEEDDIPEAELKPATPKGIATPPSPFGSSGSGSSARPSPFGAAKSATGTSSAFGAKPADPAKAADADLDDEDEDEDEVIPAEELKPATPKGIAPTPDKTATGTTLSARPAPKPGGLALNTPAEDADEEKEDDVKYEKLDDAADLDDEAADEEASKPVVLPKPPVGTLTPLAKPNGAPATTGAPAASATPTSAPATATEQKPAAPSTPASPFGSRPPTTSGSGVPTTTATPARTTPPSPPAGSPFGQRPATAAPAASSGTSASSPFGNKPLTATPTPPPTAAPVSPAASASSAAKPPVQPEIEDEVDEEDETSAEEMSTPLATTASSAPVRIQHHESDVSTASAKIDIPAFSRGNSGWPIPNFTTLLETSSSARVNEQVIQDRKNMIEETLDAFGTPGKVVEINAGPVITQFGVEPGYLSQRGGKQTRVKVSAIAKLDADLALALAAKSIRIEAPVPGKGYVGIEVPNAETAVVGLRDLMLAPEFQKINSKLRIALGKSVDGAPIVADLTTMPHLLVAGTTGSGKSVCVNAIISCLLLQNSPDELKLVMVDPKRVELTGYNGIPHLVANVVVDLERIVGVLKWVTREMEERYKKFSAAGARNILDYNSRIGPMDPKLPYLVVLIDELADLMMLAPEETEKVLTRLAQMARATGIHLILSTQRPSVDVVTGLIKANFPSRISFAVASSVDSRVILDQPGAEKLLGRGDMLYQAPDAPAPTRVQGVYVSDAEINKITQHWKAAKFEAGDGKSTPALTATTFNTAEKPAEPVQSRHSMFGGPRSDAPASGTAPRTSWEPSRDPNRAVYTSVNARESANGDDDDMYEEAVDLFKKMGKVSVSLLQRRLRVGYTRAERLIKMMKERKVITDADTTAGDGDEE